MAEFLVGVIAVFAAGTGIALTLGGTSGAEFWWARACYVVAAIALTAAYFYWDYESPRSPAARLIIGSIVGVLVIAVTPELLRWVNAREILASVRASAPPSPPLAPTPKQSNETAETPPNPQATGSAPVLEDSLVAREAFVRQLTHLYILHNVGVSNEMKIGLELPPADWLNSQLEERSKTWRVRNIRGTSFDSYNVDQPAHAENAPANAPYSGRIVVSKFQFVPNDPANPTGYRIDLYMLNRGDKPAYSPILNYSFQSVFGEMSDAEIDAEMAKDITLAIKNPPPKNTGREQVEAGLETFITLSSGLTLNAYKAIANGEKTFYLFVVLTYFDDRLQPGQYWISEFCGAPSRDFSNYRIVRNRTWLHK